TGYKGVDLLATFSNVTTNANADESSHRIFGGDEANATNTTTLTSLVQTAAGSTVAAGPRDNASTDLLHPGSYNLLALYVDTSNSSISITSVESGSNVDPTAAQNRTIDWNGNATILGDATTELLVGANGAVSSDVNVSYDNSNPNTLTVNAITNPNSHAQ